MAHLIRIGNSQGIRIPKPIIEQAELEDKELVFKVVEESLLIQPVSKARQGWAEAIEAAKRADTWGCPYGNGDVSQDCAITA